MSEPLRRTYAICVTILVVGLLFSRVLWVGLAEFNRNFLSKTFYDSYRYGQMDSNNVYQAVRLNDRQLVVVSQAGKKIEVYQVDSNGKVTRVQ